jgi:DNA topoisomerase-3
MGKKNDKAHPPIHPVQHNGNLQGDEKRVYEYITRRYLAACSKNATGAKTEVDIEIAGEAFTASGESLPHSACLTPADTASVALPIQA